MKTNCSECKEIMNLETLIDNRAEKLVKRINLECKDIRARNKERWEDFAQLVNTPIIGNFIYNLFRAPSELESDPDYRKFEWYTREKREIKRETFKLEQSKQAHLDHWGEERVEAAFAWDYSGYWMSYHPTNPMKRSDACKTYSIDGKEEPLLVFTPKRFDFHSAAGIAKTQKGIFVLDKKSKEVVPLNDCDIRWSALSANAYTLGEKIIAKFARTGCTYNLR